MTVDVVGADADPLLRVLGEPLRWRIVELLAAEELCVCHLVDELGVRQPLVSHHLKVLRDAGLVASERQSYWTYYRLRSEPFEALAHAVAGLAQAAGDGATPRRECC